MKVMIFPLSTPEASIKSKYHDWCGSTRMAPSALPRMEEQIYEGRLPDTMFQVIVTM